ncbi:histone-lysine N-methyltransferase SETMAR [Trichonephila clavipes]|nr:histone-lysine N-methyltransferase SETMAR [Trichonephila clavipes]
MNEGCLQIHQKETLKLPFIKETSMYLYHLDILVHLKEHYKAPALVLNKIKYTDPVESYRVLKMEVNKEKIRYILQFFFDRGKDASQAAEIVNGVFGADTVAANYAQFWFRRFRSGIFDVTSHRQVLRRKCR